MRLIHTFTNPKEAHHFSDFLKGEGIENQCEIITNNNWGSPDYGNIEGKIWIIEEDLTEKAEHWLSKFLENPKDPIFYENVRSGPSLEPLKESLMKGPRRLMDSGLPTQPPRTGPVTLGLVIACILIFMYGVWTEPKVPEVAPHLPLSPLYTPRINKMLMYDYPAIYDYVDVLVKEYGYDKLDNPRELPLQAQKLFYYILKTPVWNGIYDQVVAKIIEPNFEWNFTAPMFEKIHQGQIWRIFTPILLHLNEFHIFFNLLWLLMLGKLIEERTGPIRYIALILIIAGVSNTAQYLMSGSNFIGISGVDVGMMGFAWARHTRAPWEGYNINPAVARFMFLFVLGMFTVQLIFFSVHIFTGKSPWGGVGIANTAHIVGGITGYFCGYLKIFAKKNVIIP